MHLRNGTAIRGLYESRPTPMLSMTMRPRVIGLSLPSRRHQSCHLAPLPHLQRGGRFDAACQRSLPNESDCRSAVLLLLLDPRQGRFGIRPLRSDWRTILTQGLRELNSGALGKAQSCNAVRRILRGRVASQKRAGPGTPGRFPRRTGRTYQVRTIHRTQNGSRPGGPRHMRAGSPARPAQLFAALAVAARARGRATAYPDTQFIAWARARTVALSGAHHASTRSLGQLFGSARPSRPAG
jgi:hypothetical protein